MVASSNSHAFGSNCLQITIKCNPLSYVGHGTTLKWKWRYVLSFSFSPYLTHTQKNKASYIRRMPGNEPADGSGKIKVVRSDLRLHLERGEPSHTGMLEEEDDMKRSPSFGSNGGSKGWIWKGTFEHVEGMLEINEEMLTKFQFRRKLNWQIDSSKLTSRAWKIAMIITSPD